MALRHSQVFGRAAALAAWVQRLTWRDYARHRTWWSRRLLEPVFGRTEDESRFEENDLYSIAEAADPLGAADLRADRHGGQMGGGAQKLVALLRARDRGGCLLDPRRSPSLVGLASGDGGRPRVPEEVKTV
jgi:hypothetical protein